jgi:sterol desaturase/sphingolipid hydroxylase (fatty acid hydroxylase superfamily)
MMQILAWLQAHYHWQQSLILVVSLIVITTGGKFLLQQIPSIKQAAKLNHETAAKKLKLPRYAAIQKKNRLTGAVMMGINFLIVLPFCMTGNAKPWWSIPVDVVAILMVYDFFYYLTHRFLFHDGGVLGGPLLHVHAVHHQQLNPCREDSSYLNPLEQVIGAGLFIATVAVLSIFMGGFGIVTMIISFMAFSQINLHNHDLWGEDKLLFGYLNTMSRMHHHHHAKFTGGNFATITLLYDWMFGTLDNGNGYSGMRGAKAKVQEQAQA